MSHLIKNHIWSKIKWAALFRFKLKWHVLLCKSDVYTKEFKGTFRKLEILTFNQKSIVLKRLFYIFKTIPHDKFKSKTFDIAIFSLTIESLRHLKHFQFWLMYIFTKIIFNELQNLPLHRKEYRFLLQYLSFTWLKSNDAGGRICYVAHSETD